jgi:hypothetical protein
MKTPLGNIYTDKTMAEIRKLCPNAVARGEGREFFEMMLDSLIIANKIEKGLPPSSPAEAKEMNEARRMSGNVMEMMRPPSNRDTLN